MVATGFEQAVGLFRSSQWPIDREATGHRARRVGLPPQKPNGTIVAISEEPVLVFISEHADLPNLKMHEEMWVEVAVPAKGPPRPIRLGIKKDGVLTPLQLK